MNISKVKATRSAVRAVPVVEAAANIVLLDSML